MNDTKIEWATKTWNPVTGCRHGCPYCYARRIAERFGGHRLTQSKAIEIDAPVLLENKSGEVVMNPFPWDFVPTFHKYRLDEPQHIKRPQNIFVCSMADLFGDWVPDEWIRAVFEACKAAPQHRYLFLTKNPRRYIDLAYKYILLSGKNFWFGTSATDSQSADFAFRYLPSGQTYNFFLSIEPLLGDMNLFALEHLPRWIIIGAMTGPGARKNQPRREWITDITTFADNVSMFNWRRISVFMKDSLLPIVGEENMRREFPWTEWTNWKH